MVIIDGKSESSALSGEPRPTESSGHHWGAAAKKDCFAQGYFWGAATGAGSAHVWASNEIGPYYPSADRREPTNRLGCINQ
jgi:hypothetical protein